MGSNFKKWKQDVDLALEMAVVNLAMSTAKPADLVATSTDDENVGWMSGQDTTSQDLFGIVWYSRKKEEIK